MVLHILCVSAATWSCFTEADQLLAIEIAKGVSWPAQDKSASHALPGDNDACAKTGIALEAAQVATSNAPD